MALGGGTFLFQNKILPGTYSNVVSKARAASMIAGRGIATLPLELDWGITGDIFRVEKEEFLKNSQIIFGYDYGHAKMKPLRDLFQNLKTGYFYRLNSDGEKATCKHATAKYAGIRGNDISITIKDAVDDDGKKIVMTHITTEDVMKLVDKQIVAKKEDLVDNDYVTFKKSEELTAETVKLESGTNGTQVKTADFQKYLELVEPYYFNMIGYAGKDDTVKNLLINFTKRGREMTGAKFQLMIHGKKGVNYEGVISLMNDVKDDDNKGSLVYWLTGALASCEINQAITNKIYDGEYDVNTAYKQYELEQAITDGMMMFHNVADSVSGDIKGKTKVLKDINTFTDFSKHKNRDFSLNQVVRVVDNCLIDIARTFNNWYLGKSQNGDVERVDLWKDLHKLFDDYFTIGAIKKPEKTDIPIPKQGDNKEDVVVDFYIEPVVVMEKFYNTAHII